MISILIPVYKLNITSLVAEIHTQILRCNVPFEILVIDDASDKKFDEINQSITKLPNCNFKKLKTNIGRSAIRNLLAQNAIYNSLLFIDAGTTPKNKNFIENYISLISEPIVTGGMACKKEVPEKSYKLRWLYTKKREQNFLRNKKIKSLFHSSNFLIQKSIIKKFPFDESIKGYGYEDVVFHETLKKNGINIFFSNNPVIHLADDSSSEFIKKTENAIQNLLELINNGKLDYNTTKISKNYSKIKSIYGVRIVSLIFKTLKPLVLFNLNSSYPSLRLFDFYRLGYFCFKKIHS